MLNRINFQAKGHPNIQATHKTTLEFTKQDKLSVKGDCIVGVEANYDLEQVKRLEADRVKITISCEEENDSLTAQLNKTFNDGMEMVIRMSDFISDRTFATNASKGAIHLKRKLIEKAKQGKKMEVQIEAIKQEQDTKN